MGKSINLLEKLWARGKEFWIGGLRKAAIEGDIESGSLMAGQSVGLVNEVKPVKEIIRDIIDEGLQEAERINDMYCACPDSANKP